MINLEPCLLFEGNCGEAMTFYQFCLAEKLFLTTAKDTPIRDKIPLHQKEKIV
jgi:uncharacterized glyoxalase superfamily protein PhnB